MMTETCEAISAGGLCQGHADIWGGEDWFHATTKCDNPEVEHPGFPCGHPVTPADLEEPITIHHQAKFHRAAWAKQFMARIQGPGWRATNIQYKTGGIVEFDVETTEGYGQSWADWALTIGYYSSPSHPGSLDGQRAIPCY